MVTLLNIPLLVFLNVTLFIDPANAGVHTGPLAELV